jgi:YihY family inner membrane protein
MATQEKGAAGLLSASAAHVLKNPLAFALQVLRAFRANQGLLLAGAVAYYMLLSIVPLIILMVIVLSHFIGQGELLQTLSRALEWIVPGQSRALVQELASFLAHGEVVGWVLLATMLFFSSLAFKVLENAFSVIFLHRVAERRRHFLVSLLLPLGYIVFIGAALLIGTLMFVSLLAIGGESVALFGREWSLGGPARLAIYVAGICAEILLITSIYWLMPVGRLPLRHALMGGATAWLLWEIVRRALAWYFATLSQVNVVYGSLTTAIIVLLMLEIAATLLLFGAQVIAEYERVGKPGAEAPVALHTASAPTQEQEQGS